MKLFKTNNGSVDTIIANYAATGCRMTTGIAFSRQNDAGSRAELRKSRSRLRCRLRIETSLLLKCNKTSNFVLKGYMIFHADVPCLACAVCSILM